MIQVISALNGFDILATDGSLGNVVDFLFDDSNWKVRWLVVECGTWLRGRKVLIHPSAISHAGLEEKRFEVRLTRSQVENSPAWARDEPVSAQMADQLSRHYGEDPLREAPLFGVVPGAMASPMMSPPYLGLGSSAQEEIATAETRDPRLRSIAEVVGYRIEATDGLMGAVENLMLDDSDWSLPFLIVDTRSWGFGVEVLIAPAAVTKIEWSDRRIGVNVTRDQVKSSPAWDPMIAFDANYSKTLHRYYGWPGSQS